MMFKIDSSLALFPMLLWLLKYVIEHKYFLNINNQLFIERYVVFVLSFSEELIDFLWVSFFFKIVLFL